MWRGLALSSLLGVLVGCYDFHLQGPEDPSPVGPRLVSVTVEYRQPAGCVNSTGRCDDQVVFFGSWMRSGGAFALQRDAAGYIWRGVAQGVPVNFPPGEAAHAVRVYDPHIHDHPSGGVTAERLTVGGQILTYFVSEDSPSESGLVYIDDNGRGHNPF